MKKTEELKQLKAKGLKDLPKDLLKEYNKLRELKFSQGFRKLKDLRMIKKTKKRIARIWTTIGEKSLEKTN